ncbi:hypothetical protein [Arthrobacter woluwensis]|uniref:hypothetical protein n=1 Tax=Arthrobacter woluwensis TaxID=156980 RepID=UPI00119C96DB|nr:hypothetical protein [Arthrobacter woluwensis]
MSIKSHFVSLILRGTKTYELRRRVPREATGMTVFIYSSGKDRAVTARATVAGVISGRPEAIWRDHSDELGICRDDFFDYFSGVDTAYAIRLSDVSENSRQVTLDELRKDFGLEPPQSWRYIPSEPYERLLEAI